MILKNFLMIKYFKWLKKLLHKDIQKPLKLLKMKELNQYRKEKNVIQFSETFDGIKFRSYFDVNTGRITNIHPE